MSEFLAADSENVVNEPDVGLTPLVDVVFQLLVFFILTSTFATPVLDVVLPQLSETQSNSESNAWRIELDAEGQLALEGQNVASDTFENLLTTLISEYPERRNAILAADEKADHGAVLELMQKLGNLGINQLYFEHTVGEGGMQ